MRVIRLLVKLIVAPWILLGLLALLVLCSATLALILQATATLLG